MKNIIIIFLILTNLPVYAQQTQDIKMRPHEVTQEEEEVFEKLGLPEEWNCRIETCPEKIYRANGANLFALSDEDQSSINLSLANRLVKRMKSNDEMYCFFRNGTLKVYKLGKGLIKEINGIRVLAGDK